MLEPQGHTYCLEGIRRREIASNAMPAILSMAALRLASKSASVVERRNWPFSLAGLSTHARIDSVHLADLKLPGCYARMLIGDAVQDGGDVVVHAGAWLVVVA